VHKLISPVLTAAALAVLVVASGSPASIGVGPAKPPPRGSATRAFTATADAFVSAAAPHRNFGALRVLRVDRSPVKRGYLRFNVQGLRGKVVRAELRVFALTGSQKGYDVLGVRGRRFRERAITYATAPTVSRVTGSARSFKARGWTAVDVTRLVSGNGIVDFALATASRTTIELASRESGARARPLGASGQSGTTAPLLLVETTRDQPTDGKRPSAPSPSGKPMPVGDLPGWRQIFTDDFTTNVPLGQFPAAVSRKWTAYAYPWKGTPNWATYDPQRTTSFHDGLMDIWIHTVNGEHLIAANEPKINGASAGRSQLYGRYAIRFRADAFGYYKASWLLWPQSGVWPRDGEIDFPEGEFDGKMYAFMHRQDGTSGGDQDAYASGVTWTSWHTAVIEWLPSRCTFILDGRVIGQSTSRIPNTPMRYVIQNGGRFDTGVAPDLVQGHIYIDWIAVYKPA
jgi:hypothetical protein